MTVTTVALAAVWSELAASKETEEHYDELQPKAGTADFDYLERKVLEWGEPKVPSAKQLMDPQPYDPSLRHFDPPQRQGQPVPEQPVPELPDDYDYDYPQVVGWSIWFSGAIFLERSWEKDEKTLKAGFQRLRDFPCAFWLGLFVEGTRFTQAKLLAAQEYASSMGLPTPRNVLIPRTKGFVAAVNHMREFVPAIYDLTFAFSKDSPPPTMLRLLKGKPSVVHVHIKRHLMKDLPKTNEAVAQWCKDDFLVKDKLLDKHKDDDNFGDGELHEIGRPVKSLVVVTAWACLLILGTLKFLQWSSLLSSWKGLTFSSTGLAILTVLMQFLIQSTQSERSNPSSLSKAVR